MSKVKLTKTGNKIYDTGWIPITLQNGWQNYSDKFTGEANKEYSDAAYRCINDIVYLQGLIVPQTGYNVSKPTLLSTSIPATLLPSKSKLYRFGNGTELRATNITNGYTPFGLSVVGNFTDYIVDLSIISWPVD